MSELSTMDFLAGTVLLTTGWLAKHGNWCSCRVQG
jgi:hypothetical protein